MSADIPRRTILALPPAAALLIASSRETALAQPPGAPAVSGYRLVDLGISRFASGAVAINAAGTVAGSSYDAKGRKRPVIWVKGRLRDVGPAVAEYGIALAISDRGDVIGHWGTMAGAGGYFLWTAGRRTTLPKTFTPRAVNSSRRVAGSAALSDGRSIPAVWYRGRVTSLRRYGLTAGPQSAAEAINDAGQIAGVDGTGPFLLSRGTLRRPPAGALRLGDVGGLTPRGVVVGSGSHSGGPRHPLLWTRTGLVDVSAPGVPGYGYGEDANEAGRVVGSWITDELPDGTPVVWFRRRMIVLPLLGRTPGVPRAAAINAAGVITGSSTPAKDLAYENSRAVVWVPVTTHSS